MSLNIKKYPFLFSTGTQLAYKIAQRYYGDVHYVWCTTEFNPFNQPPSSNPCMICNKYLNLIKTGDRHAHELYDNMAGILRGALSKFNSGIIDKTVYNKIRSIVSGANYEAFFPVIYLIRSSKVREKCIEVPVKDRASDNSVEYKIEELKGDEFEPIFLEDILHGIVKVVQKKVGE